MFNLFTKQRNAPTSDFSFIGVDIHSHLIPAIDDGSKAIEETLGYIRSLSARGFKKIITTPHIYKEYYPNTPETILGGLQKVKTALEATDINVTFHAAAEYFMDEHFEYLLENEKLLTLDGRHVLVETSFYGAMPNFDLNIFKMQTKGYIPILAHPERYNYLPMSVKVFEQLRDAGCLLQLNMLSLIGYYGKDIEQKANFLLKHKLIDLIGTDLHHERHLAGVENTLRAKDLMQTLQKYKFLNCEIFFS